MANVVLSDLAPNEKVRFLLAGEEIELGGNAKKSFETDNPEVIANATVHPWLNVEAVSADVIVRYRPGTVDPKQDPLSAEGPNARLPFDEKAVAEFEDSKVQDFNPVAIEAGVDQDKSVSEGGIAETLPAAEDVDETRDLSVEDKK